jgi:transposase
MADGELPSEADRAFAARLLRRKGDDRLDEALDEAAASPLASLVAELRKDIAAVRAALELPWTTNPVEARSIGSR